MATQVDRRSDSAEHFGISAAAHADWRQLHSSALSGAGRSTSRVGNTQLRDKLHIREGRPAGAAQAAHRSLFPFATLSLKFHDARRSADSSFRVAYDSQAIQTIYNKGFTNIFGSVITLVGVFVIMLQLDWQLTLLSLGIVP